MQVTKCDRCGGQCAEPEGWLHLSDNRDFCKMCTKRLVKIALEAMIEESKNEIICCPHCGLKIKLIKEN